MDLSYRKIAEELHVSWRTVARATKLLQEQGDILLERLVGGAYRWVVPIEREEILADPEQRFQVRGSESSSNRPHDKFVISPHDNSDISPMTHLSWEQPVKASPTNPTPTSSQAPSHRPKTEPLKKVFKEKDLKKEQQHDRVKFVSSNCSKQPDSKTQAAARSAVDEPLYKSLLKKLRSYGVSQRVARQLCRDCEHKTIESVLNLVPELQGIQNLAGYIVTAIRDGGYQSKKRAASNEAAKNYAYLTGDTVKRERNENVKSSGDAPIQYRSVEETRQEKEAELKVKTEREDLYKQQSRELSKRFRSLSEDIQRRLKSFAKLELDNIIPKTKKRDEMVTDPSFQRLANRNVLERFFTALDQGIKSDVALGCI